MPMYTIKHCLDKCGFKDVSVNHMKCMTLTRNLRAQLQNALLDRTFFRRIDFV